MSADEGCCCDDGVAVGGEAKGKGGVGYVLFLAFVAAVPSLATDMYLAAIPKIAEEWGVKVGQISYSLSLWFVLFSTVILLLGPVSDRWGRKPVLMGGMLVFAVGSLLSGMSVCVWQLIAFRLLQAIGAAGPTSMVIAICRDKFEGKKRKSVLAWVAIILNVAPICSPSIGAVLMDLLNWRAIFFSQAAMGVLGCLLTLIVFKESAGELVKTGAFKMMARYFVLMKNKRYMVANYILGTLPGPFCAFLGFSSIAYINIFGLSEYWFGVLFACNAGTSMVGAFLSTRLNGRMSDGKMLWVAFVGCLMGGLGMLCFGWMHPFVFAGTMGVITLSTTLSRPVANHLILEQVKRDIGVASSFVSFYQYVMMAVFVWFVSLDWGKPMLVFGLVTLCVPMGVALMWAAFGSKMILAEEGKVGAALETAKA